MQRVTFQAAYVTGTLLSRTVLQNIERQLRLKKNTGIHRYTSNRFTSFRLYEMHKLIPAFQFTSEFSLILAPSSCKPIVVPGASSREVMGN
jgi:hypothetical protein